ncbi:phage portal protein [Thermoanaerobacterium sp. PSU-2]|uniref:phage portal protein n=1 Tax=Thermoanaerobacterium sp. PSU-2 TaxID=1930849 RepID=UPI000A14E512|nr:phage portal protein [Thermoanaerobacterium sp. PSU-2]ORX22484.1 phage portal protein [Thermoanaerobacterium sp. PSU-2]
MNIFQRIFNRSHTKEKSAPFSYYPLNWQIPPDRKETDWLKAYQENNWVFAAVSKIAQSVAATEWRLFTRDSQGTEIDIIDGPIYQLLQKPNPFMPFQEFIELSQIYLELTGEVYWALSKNGMGQPAEMWPVPSDRMWVVPDKDNFIKGYIYIWGGENIPFDPDEVIHITYPNPLNVHKGVGPTQAAGLQIDNDSFAQQYARNFFYNSAVPGGYIAVPHVLTEDEFTDLKERWNLGHQGVDKAHKIAVLEGGAEYKQTAFSIRDLQLTDVRKQNRDDILATFGVHASILGISENVNRANAEAAEYTFAKRTIEPRLRKLEGKINNELIPMFKPKTQIIFDFNQVIPEDVDTVIKKVQVGIQSGIMTVNEARNLLGLEDIDGGDVLYISNQIMPQPISDVEPDTSEGEVETGQEQDMTKSFKTKTKGANTAWRKFVGQQTKYEKKFKKALKPIWEEMQKDVEESIRNGRGAFFDAQKYKDKFYKVGYEQIKTIHNDFAEQAYNEVFATKAMKIKKDFDPSLHRIAEWIQNKTFKFAQQITQDTEEMLRQQLEEANANGEDIDQIMRRVAEVFDISATGYRAERIARTETVPAANAGALEGYRQTGLVSRKTWLTAEDERVREWHQEADGQTVGIDEPFIVGGEELDFPGDPNGSAENIIQCRCTVIPVIDE